MAKFVNNVFVGKGVAPADLDTLSVGSVTIVDEKDAAPSATSKHIRVVKVTGKRNIIMPNGTSKNISICKSTDLLNRNEIVEEEIVMVPFKAAAEKTITVDFTAATFPAGYNRVMLRVLMKDIEGTKTQITKTFDHVSDSLTGASVSAGLAKQINKYYGDVIIASDAAGVLTLTAAPAKTYPGTEMYSEFQQNDFTISASVTAIKVTYEQKAIPGVVETVTQAAFKGAGTPELVRDRERSGLSHDGAVFFTRFPYNSPSLTVDMNKTYDSLTFSYNKAYRSVEEQYMQSTPRSVEIYVEAGTGAALETILKDFYEA